MALVVFAVRRTVGRLKPATTGDKTVYRYLRLGAVVGVILLACSSAGDAQQRPPDTGAQPPADQQQPATPADQQTPVFRAGINFVRVDVIITDKAGNPIGDLKDTDFEVTEDNKPQKIETFKLVSLDGGLVQATERRPRQIRTDADEEQEAARDDVRLFAIFLDDYHVTQDSSLAVRNQIARFVETSLGPSDMIGIMYPLQSLVSMRMTRNHDAVMRGLQRFVGRKHDYTPRNSYEERYAYYPTEIVEQVRNQVSLSAIKGLITHLGTLKDGRKALLLVTEGYANMLPPQMRDPVAALPGLGNPNLFDPQAGNSPLEDRAAAMAFSDLYVELREVWNVANKNNTAIYTIDPRGLAAFEFGLDKPAIDLETDAKFLNSTRDTLRILADNSDGRAIVNRNDITGAMKQIVRDSSAYYLLGYTSSQPSDGKFHEIKVRVKRSGVQVRARKGYWAATRDDAARALAPPRAPVSSGVERALASATRVTRASLIRTWVGTERGENGKTRVTFVWEPAPTAPGDAARSSGQPARVALTAAGLDGTPYFRGRIPGARSPAESSRPVASAVSAAAAASRVTFEAAPGKLQLRLSVENAGSELLDSEVREIVVPDLTSAKPVLGTPQVFRTRTPRELQQLKADPQAVPTAGREFSRTERLSIRVPAYGAGSEPPKLTARLLNRAGQPMTDLAVARSEGSAAAPQIEVPLAGLAPGEYVIEISAGGEGDAKELIGFRVTG